MSRRIATKHLKPTVSRPPFHISSNPTLLPNSPTLLRRAKLCLPYLHRNGFHNHSNLHIPLRCHIFPTTSIKPSLPPPSNLHTHPKSDVEPHCNRGFRNIPSLSRLHWASGIAPNKTNPPNLVVSRRSQPLLTTVHLYHSSKEKNYERNLIKPLAPPITALFETSCHRGCRRSPMSSFAHLGKVALPPSISTSITTSSPFCHSILIRLGEHENI